MGNHVKVLGCKHDNSNRMNPFDECLFQNILNILSFVS